MSFFKHEDFEPAPSNWRCWLLFVWNIIRIFGFMYYAVMCVLALSYCLDQVLLDTTPSTRLMLDNPLIFILSYLLLLQGFLYKTSRLDTSLGWAVCTYLTFSYPYFSGVALETSVIPWVVFLLNNDIQVCKF